MNLDFILRFASIALTALCWGAYGPVLHRGQTAMDGSRLRPLLCVGMAYFVIAVVVPLFWLYTRGEKGDWTFSGIVWSSGGGVAGAIGALGIILAFNFGGKPSYVMPLVFGCAPVINAFLTIYMAGAWKDVSPLFLAGLVIVAMGAVMVLVFAPKGHAPGPTGSAHAPPAVVEPVEGH
ncbi:MAG TPA: hypothetical protein VHD36_08365 [Pirellulales bacterium]|nr:hypothetical protein [Pirellulales bacterium]